MTEPATPVHLPARRVRARDGVHLGTDVYLPAGAGPWPATLVRTPYGRTFYHADADRLCGDGVAVVVQDVRGRFDSEGEWDLGAGDLADGADAVAWIRAQPWSDGRVAGRGASYPGMTTWRTAIANPPGLVCAAPTMCPPWWQHLNFREGGAVLLALAAHWLPLQLVWHPRTSEEVAARATERAFDFAAALVDDRVDAAAALALPSLGRLPLRDPWPVEGSPLFEHIWQRIFDPPAAVSPLDDPGPAPGDRVEVPVLITGAWYDVGWSQGQVDAFAAIRRTSPPEVAAQHRLVMVPSGHGFDPFREHDPGPEAGRFHLDTDHEWALEWFGEPGPLRQAPPVTYFLLNDGWRTADDWPPPGAAPVRFHLHPDGMALSQTPPAAEASAGWVFDPADPVPTRGGGGLGLPPGPCDQTGLTGGARDDVLSFTTEPLRAPMAITGSVVAGLAVVSDAPDTDVTVKLVDVHPDGRAWSITDGILRGRYRHGPDPVLLAPGEVEPFRVHAGCVGYLVDEGHRLRVDVSSSNFPKYDRNPNTGAPEGTDTAGELRVARNRLVSSPEHPSYVEVTLLP